MGGVGAGRGVGGWGGWGGGGWGGWGGWGRGVGRVAGREEGGIGRGEGGVSLRGHSHLAVTQKHVNGTKD